MTNLKRCIDRLIEEKTLCNVIVRVGRGEQILCEEKASAEGRILTADTLFDMASVTKIVATTSLALLAMDAGELSADDPVGKFFPVPGDKRDLSVHHLMTHTIGIGYKLLTDVPPHNIVDHILRIPSDIPMGSNVRYSCPGFILLGKILEQIYGTRLDEAFQERVAKPLGLKNTCFLPPKGDIINANLTPDMVGVVNDCNCRHLDGVAGNAGLFSNLSDMTVYAGLLLQNGAPLLSEGLFAEATRNHTEGMTESRGLGFLYVDGRYSQTGDLFAEGSFGHCGHTGQSVFADPKSGLYAIILSDATVSTAKKYGHERYAEVIAMRRDIHAAIKADLQQKGVLLS